MSEGAIRPGTLRHRVRIESRSGSLNDYGERTGWSTVATVWARVSPVTAREAGEADQVEARRTHLVTMHHRDDVDASMRLVLIADGSRVLNIEGVRDLGGQHRGMQLDCVEAGETDA